MHRKPPTVEMTEVPDGWYAELIWATPQRKLKDARVDSCIAITCGEITVRLSAGMRRN